MVNSLNKKICVFVHELNRTGASIVMYDAIAVMLKAGHGVMVISPMDGVLRDDYSKIGAEVIISEECYTLIVESRIGKHYDIQLSIDQYIQEFDQIWCLTVVTASIVKRYQKLGIPIVWWIHEGLAVLERYYRCMPKKLTDNVLPLVCGSYTARVLELYHFSYPVAVLHYGVKDEAVDYTYKMDEKINFVLAGSICPRKAQDILLLALNYLPQDVMENTQYIIIGSGKNQEYLNKINELAASYNNVRFVPNISRQEVYEYYKEMACLICPSRDDPMPVVISEAAMFSKPVICSDFTGQADYIRQADEDMVFENLSPEGLAKAIIKIYHNSKLRKLLGMYNRKMYEENFVYDIMKENILQIVNSL